MASHRAQHVGAAELEEAGPLKQRLFFGLPVPAAQRALLGSYLERCVAGAPAFRWVPAANLHLTIRFLGSVTPGAAGEVADRLAASGLRKFEIELGGAGTFGRGRKVRVVWIGLRAGGPAATDLAATVDRACVEVGLQGEERAFQPHLTLARSRHRDGEVLPELPPAPALQAWRADELILYRSRLGRAAATYEPLRSLRLG